MRLLIQTLMSSLNTHLIISILFYLSWAKVIPILSKSYLMTHLSYLRKGSQDLTWTFSKEGCVCKVAKLSIRDDVRSQCLKNQLQSLTSVSPDQIEVTAHSSQHFLSFIHTKRLCQPYHRVQPWCIKIILRGNSEWHR